MCAAADDVCCCLTPYRHAGVCGGGEHREPDARQKKQHQHDAVTNDSPLAAIWLGIYVLSNCQSSDTPSSSPRKETQIDFNKSRIFYRRAERFVCFSHYPQVSLCDGNKSDERLVGYLHEID